MSAEYDKTRHDDAASLQGFVRLSTRGPTIGGGLLPIRHNRTTIVHRARGLPTIHLIEDRAQLLPRAAGIGADFELIADLGFACINAGERSALRRRRGQLSVATSSRNKHKHCLLSYRPRERVVVLHGNAVVYEGPRRTLANLLLRGLLCGILPARVHVDTRIH
jgi:hypothetical protein